jgi:hypothetical protein
MTSIITSRNAEKKNEPELGVMVLNVPFNNISAISWRSVLLAEQTGIPGENHWPATSH